MYDNTLVLNHLKQTGLRPTRQRLMIGMHLWTGRWATETRHLTAEQLHSECKRANMQVSMATVYNTLHQFVEAGLLREVVMDNGCSYFDTNISPHHHFYYVESQQLEDIPQGEVVITKHPAPRDKHYITEMHLTIRLRETREPEVA